jgi:predicted phosphoribosyltransferase
MRFAGSYRNRLGGDQRFVRDPNGLTVRAILALRERDPARLIVAVPVAPPAAIETIRPLVDELVCIATPEPFRAVGRWYEDFAEVTHDEVSRLLRKMSEPEEGEQR